MSQPDRGTISRQIRDKADHSEKQFGRPPFRREVCTPLDRAGFYPETVSTRYEQWGHHVHPEPDATRHASNISIKLPTRCLPASQPSPSSGWTILLKNGFTYLGNRHLTETGELTVDRSTPQSPGIHASTCNDEIVHGKKSESPLHTRLADYRRGCEGQKTNLHIKARILHALEKGEKVRGLVATPGNMEWNSLPVITLHGLEAGGSRNCNHDGTGKEKDKP